MVNLMPSFLKSIIDPGIEREDNIEEIEDDESYYILDEDLINYDVTTNITTVASIDWGHPKFLSKASIDDISSGNRYLLDLFIEGNKNDPIDDEFVKSLKELKIPKVEESDFILYINQLNHLEDDLKVRNNNSSSNDEVIEDFNDNLLSVSNEYFRDDYKISKNNIFNLDIDEIPNSLANLELQLTIVNTQLRDLVGTHLNDVNQSLNCVNELKDQFTNTFVFINNIKDIYIHLSTNSNRISIESPSISNCHSNSFSIEDSSNKRKVSLSDVPPEVQSTSPCLADSSSNYLSLKSIATPGDRGEVNEEEQEFSTRKNEDNQPLRTGILPGGTKNVNPEEQEVNDDVTSSGCGLPGSDPRELEGEVIRRGTTPSGRPQVESRLKDKEMTLSINYVDYGISEMIVRKRLMRTILDYLEELRAISMIPDCIQGIIEMNNLLLAKLFSNCLIDYLRDELNKFNLVQLITLILEDNIDTIEHICEAKFIDLSIYILIECFNDDGDNVLSMIDKLDNSLIVLRLCNSIEKTLDTLLYTKKKYILIIFSMIIINY